MIKNFLLTAFRNAFKNWTYSLINILGLSVGLAAVIYIFLFVRFEKGYDSFNENAEQIYRVGVYGMMMNNEINQAVTAAPMAEAMLNDYPEVENVCRLRESGDWLIVYDDHKINEKEFLFADSTFFEVFSYKLLKGDPSTALVEPRSIVMTEKGAKRYFGNEDPIGKLLRVERDTVLYKVTGLMEDPPENAHFHFDLLGSMSTLAASRRTFWVSHNFYTYVQLEEGTDPIEFEKKMQTMVEKYVGPQIEQVLGIKMDEFAEAGNTFNYFIQPLLDIHLHSDLQYEIEANGNVLYLYIFISIAIFILVIASINFTNLSTARAANRSKEVGIRKVVGATKNQLIIQFLMESFIISAVSFLVAVVILELAMPGLNNLVQIPLDIRYFACWYIVPILFALIVVVSIMAGSYPAFFLASFKPAAVLKGKLKLGAKSGKLRSVLVIVQFVVSVFILLSTYTVSDQLKYILNKDLGFDRDNILMIRRSDALRSQMEAFKAELKHIVNVKEVSNANAYPGVNFSNNAFFLKGESLEKMYLLNQAWVSYDYEKVFNFELIEGRFFSTEYSDSNAIVINEAAVKSLGLENPIGSIILSPADENQFVERPVIGVVKDFNFKTLHTAIEPAAFTLMPGNWEGVVCVKIKSNNINSTIEQVHKVWNEFDLNYPFEYFFFDDHLADLYRSEQRTNRIFILFSLLSILIAFMGLLGLISFITEQRKKEIGIRKTFGSTSVQIVYTIAKDILVLIFIASVIAWPITYWVMDSWLQDFSYRVNINYFMFVVITIFTIILSLTTVIYQTVKAALKNPAETLRYE